MKRFLVTSAMMMTLMCSPSLSYAQEGGVGSLVTTSLLGTSIGLLAGTVSMVFMNNPGDHTDRAAYGAAIGCACGFALGLSGMISPTYHSSVTNHGKKEHIFGLQVYIPLRREAFPHFIPHVAVE